MKTLIEKSKYLSLFAVISLLITFVLSLFWGISQAINNWMKIILSIGQAPDITISILKLIDVFLIAIFLYILAVSIYKMFIGDVKLPTSLVARNIAELKGKLSSVIVLVMAVHFVEILFEDGISGLEKVWYAIATALVTGVLVAFSYLGTSHGNENHQE
jgi:uncharacterized membrane protein YqhA